MTEGTLLPITQEMYAAARASLWARRASRQGVQYVEVMDMRSLSLEMPPKGTRLTPERSITLRVVLTAWEWKATGRVAGHWVCRNPVCAAEELGT